MGDAIIRRCLASRSPMDGDRSGHRLCSLGRGCCPHPAHLLGCSWEMPHGPKRHQSLFSQRALCNHNTWPQGRQDCVSKVSLQVRDPGNPTLGIHLPVPTRLHLPPQASPGTPGITEWGNPKAPCTPGLWRHSAHKSASRPTTHLPYTILTWTPVLPEKHTERMCIPVQEGETHSRLFPPRSLITLGQAHGS